MIRRETKAEQVYIKQKEKERTEKDEFDQATKEALDEATEDKTDN
jgi:hypothetical protein